MEEEEEEENGVFFTSTSSTLIPFHSQNKAKMLFCKPFTFFIYFPITLLLNLDSSYGLSISLTLYSFSTRYRIDTG